MRKLAEMLLVIFFFHVLFISAMFFIFTENNLWSFFATAFVNTFTYLEDSNP